MLCSLSQKAINYTFSAGIGGYNANLGGGLSEVPYLDRLNIVERLDSLGDQYAPVVIMIIEYVWKECCRAWYKWQDYDIRQDNMLEVAKSRVSELPLLVQGEAFELIELFLNDRIKCKKRQEEEKARYLGGL